MNFKEQLYLEILDNEKLRNHNVNEDKRSRILEEVIRIKLALDAEEVSLLNLRIQEEIKSETKCNLFKVKPEIKTRDNELFDLTSSIDMEEMKDQISDVISRTINQELNSVDVSDDHKAFTSSFVKSKCELIAKQIMAFL